MSRTYRRKKALSDKQPTFLCSNLTPTLCHKWTGERVYRYLWKWFDHYPTKEEMAKAEAEYMSDGGTSSPRPSWFRNMNDTRPSRRKNKREIQKYMLDPDYEPMCYGKGRLDYWI